MLQKIQTLSLLLISFFFSKILKVQKGKIIAWSWGGRNYSCNPAHISNYLLENYPDEYSITWMFLDPNSVSVPKGIKKVKARTIRFLKEINTAEFIISNTRTTIYEKFLFKKKEQKYIMTWHSSMGLKKIEADAVLPASYVKKAKKDSLITDLILSGSKFRTGVIKRSFWYCGEILEKGTPRNDLLFNSSKSMVISKSIREKYNIENEAKVVLYAPTFRTNGDVSAYSLNWKLIINKIGYLLKSNNVYLLFRLHPGLLTHSIDISNLFNYEHFIDVSKYPDIQDLLTCSDLLITDYSSSMFDAACIHKPCFLYVSDLEHYDRGTYMQIKDLPFPFARTEQEFVDVIEKFDMFVYKNRVSNFLSNVVGSAENGKATEALVDWMKKNGVTRSNL